ncbi:hypothetical protein B4U79_01502 [Dinothrombium tinctorium]|uniref:Protein slit-like protein n=1 Tax=Dinothrombium tinctorium TaxID=1965070 RepID=A0A3S3NS74_9ACAR|nr:hypothetical protein B4U79_03632 [Dinothrombium tinctorium]RWS05725.1 hypothetical protein B4U79_00830 [Dinothrombium tinctorium]RWS08211.1 hypothetical protein B4U79_01502 [Dinothrombium tinctorium]
MFLNFVFTFFAFVAFDAYCHEIDHHSACPYRQVFYPCKCSVITYDSVNYYSQITCKGVNGLQLKDIFHSARYANVSRYYDIIEITEVPLLNLCCEDLFGGFHFKKIKITFSTICVINYNAFLTTEHFTKEITLINTHFTANLADGNQLFKTIRKFKDLRGLFIISSNLEALPEDALRSPNRHFGQDLEVIRICNTKISRIPDYAFYDLPRLIWIDFGNNYITHVNSKTFALRSTIDTPIEISLSANNLTSSGITDGAFSGIRRQKVEIYITENRLDTLYEQIFNPLLRTEYVFLFVDHNPFVCDCRHRWLFNHKEDNQYHLKGMTCREDGRSIWEKNFDHCDKAKLVDTKVDIFGRCCRRHNHQQQRYEHKITYIPEPPVRIQQHHQHKISYIKKLPTQIREYNHQIEAPHNSDIHPQLQQHHF